MAKKETITFGMYLRSLREASQMTLKDVSIKTGIDISLLAKIERSERQPTRDFIKKAANLFNIDKKKLVEEYLSEQIAYKILDEDIDLNILKVAENKVSFLKRIRNG